jgi:ubiquinone/menaquinone biosynthesis C-methylase UbiE
MTIHKNDAAYAGQAIYTRSFLRTYDALVYGFNSPVLWRCPKKKLIEHYDTYVSERHLDIGVGTGCLLDQCCFPAPSPSITLMDLNPNSLAAAAKHLARFAPTTHQANVLQPWRLPPESFDSVGMNYLLHCLPGTMPEKVLVFEQARAVLAAGGVLFGSTILTKGVEHTRLSRFAMKSINRLGVLCNLHDHLTDLDAGLARVFPSHEVHVCGAVALFSARVPA